MKVADVKICADCDELVNRYDKACPSCTCTHFMLLSRIIQPLPQREEIEVVRKIEQTYKEHDECA